MKKTSIILTLILLVLISPSQATAQIQPGWKKAEADVHIKQGEITHFLEQYGFSSTNDFQLSQKSEPYVNYSYKANNTLYKYLWEPDLIVYSFYAKAPLLASGDEFTFIFSISYARSRFSGDQGELTNTYQFYSLGASIHEYKGKDLNEAVLNKCLFDYGKGGFYVQGKYQFAKVDSIKYERTEESTAGSNTAQQYNATVFGEAVRELGEYEYSSVAYLEAEFSMTIDANNGGWEVTWLKRTGTEPKLTNIHENPNYPAVNLTKDVGLLPTFQQYDRVVVESDQYRYLKDLCRLLDSERHREKEDFLSIDQIKRLFSGEKGAEALDQLYKLYAVFEKYSLTVSATECSTRYGMGVKPDNGNSIKFSFTLSRELTKEELKTMKSEGASKQALAVAKYPAKGYVYLVMELENHDDELTIVDSYINNELVLKNGNNSKHPLE